MNEPPVKRRTPALAGDRGDVLRAIGTYHSVIELQAEHWSRHAGRLLCAYWRKRSTSLQYHALTLVQRPFGFVFWLIEQRKARLQDRFENERSKELPQFVPGGTLAMGDQS